MTTPARWARGDRAVIYITVESVVLGVATVRLPGGDTTVLAASNLAMLSPDDAGHSSKLPPKKRKERARR